jgi:hypothetical protein
MLRRDRPHRLMARVRRRIADKHVLVLVKAFLKAGILSEDGRDRETITGTPQGGILSPLLANIALGVLDEHLSGRPQATRSQRRERPSYRLVRYADDWVVLVRGTRVHAEALRDETAAVLAPMGLRLSEAKTRICHIDEGFDFLGFRIQRQPKKHNPRQRAVYTWPSKKALAAVKAKVRALTRAGSNQPLAALLGHLNRVLRGWTAFFCYGCPRPPSTTWASSPGTGSCDGCAASIPRRVGVAASPLPAQVVADARQDGAAALRARDGAPLPLPRRADPLAVDGDRVSSPTRWACGEPDAGELARPVRRCGPGQRIAREDDTAPRSDPTPSPG